MSNPDEIDRRLARIEKRQDESDDKISALELTTAVLKNTLDIMQRNQVARQSNGMSWATAIFAAGVSILIWLAQYLIQRGGVP